MSNNELLADRIEQAIGKMVEYFAKYDSGIREYTFFYNPNVSKSWVIVFFSDDKTKLKSSLNNGTCYAMFQFLQSELNLIEEQLQEQLPRSILFDSGQRPQNDEEREQLFEKYTKTYDTEADENGQARKCLHCSHDWDKHVLRGYEDEENTAPKQGWMVCPDEDCFCFLTWSR